MPTRTDRRTTRVTAETSPHGPRLVCHPGTFSARVTSVSGRLICAALVATEAGLLGGDDIGLDLRVEAGLTLALTDVAALVAYDGRELPAAWHVAVDLDSGACLDWRCEPLIVTDGAMVSRSLEATLAGSARLVVDETVVLGRSGQSGGVLDCATAVWRSGLPILIEQVTYDGRPAAPGQRFIRGEHRVVRTRLDTGPVSAAHAGEGTTLHLASGGTVTRWFS